MHSLDKFSSENAVSILNSLHEGVYVIDKEFKILFVNKAASKITNIEPQEVIGKICRSFCKSERCEIGCPITEVLRTDKDITDLESSLQNNNGGIIPIKLNASILKNEKNEPIGGIISFRKNEKTDFEDYLKKGNFYGIIGKSKVMTDIFSIINETARTNVQVLITGETGAGKEMIANAIHKLSSRRDKIFVKVNCANLHDNLLASELFGHVKGAFTDAVKDRVGRFEYANGGTIFLDEIGEMPINMQTQLLRILQDGTFERVGESIARKVDVRIIAATNKKLEEEIRSRKFREDLYYRLNVIPIKVPPLREHKEDLILLVEHFIKKYSKKYNKKIDRVPPDTMDLLMNYNWPGNIRELENTIEYAFLRSKREDYLCVCSLPPQVRSNSTCIDKLTIKELELDEKTETLLSLLRQNNWNKTRVAKILGINRSTIHRQLKNLNKL